MSAKGIREYEGKLMLAHWLPKAPTSLPTSNLSFSAAKVAQLNMDHLIKKGPEDHSYSVALQEAFQEIERTSPWVLQQKLVAKPDQLIKRRGKSGLLKLNATWEEVKNWISGLSGNAIKVGSVEGILSSFIIEPFLPHSQDTEHYICINSVRDGDMILYHHEGGIDIGDVDSKALSLLIPTGKPLPSHDQLKSTLLKNVPSAAKDTLAEFISRLYSVYVDLQFTYLEINPLVVLENGTLPPQICYLDLAAKLDQTAEFEAGTKWAEALNAYKDVKKNQEYMTQVDFPAPFGRLLSKEEAYIAELDSKTGASLKLTILNEKGRIWTMVAGGGASVVYSDAIAAHGFAHELANYGEYSGAPSEVQTYEYAKTILDLMTRKPHPTNSKILFIGGGIANFTNVAATFKGIIRSLKEFKDKLKSVNTKIYVRRAGPNYQEGLRLMREVGETLGLEIHVFGPETHITHIVPLALKGKVEEINMVQTGVESTSPKTKVSVKEFQVPGSTRSDRIEYFSAEVSEASHPWYMPFTKYTRCFVYGLQNRAVQGMLDFDYMCKRETPSVAAMIYPFGGSHVQKFYWGAKETLIPVYQSIKEAVEKFPLVDTIVNFASCRSVHPSTLEMMTYQHIKSIAIIAEGVPERRAKEILEKAKENKVLIIGPATVGGIKPGCFKIGNTGGMMDNIVDSKLYRPGSVAYVSKSGGMSNELNNIISRSTNGVYEGVAIGGDRYPGSTFIDHILRFEADPEVKIIVLLGEVGGVEEYEVVKAVKDGRIKKPIVAWCIGTCAGMFGSEVQFGHAGALANSDMETAEAKNKNLREAGVHVPDTFEHLPKELNTVYKSLVNSGVIQPMPEPEPPKVPIDYAWAQELGLVRKPASFVSTICDDRGQELLYAGMRISEVFKEDIGIGGVVSLLWFKRRLPDYFTKFIEMVLMLTADHGPAVSGAHNTIVTARAGKDLVSALCSGMLTIGDRFGGALDGAAAQFSKAYDENLTPRQFVDKMRKENKLILGIGHKIKSRTNPDLRVTLLKDYATQHFPSTPILNYALSVEQITTSKKDNLILNVDGAIGVLFVDLLRGCGAFSAEESEEYIKIGTLNGLFVLGRSIGFIGHFLDQKRLKQGLYRHPWDDISYITPDQEFTRRAFVGANDLKP